LPSSEFWQSTIGEVRSIEAAYLEKQKRELKKEAHFTACLLNFIGTMFSKDFKAIGSDDLIGSNNNDASEIDFDLAWAALENRSRKLGK
jgi:hypothetical protein